MKPKTKLDFRVTGLRSKLPKLSVAQNKWAEKECFFDYVTSMGKNIYCLDCGHQWKTGLSGWKNDIDTQCPECKKKLTMFNHNGDSYKSEMFSIYNHLEEFQVQRIFEIKKYMKKRTKARFFVIEVAQNWVATNGKTKTLSMTQTGGYYGERWNYYSGLEVRSSSGMSYSGYSRNSSVADIITPFTYPKAKIHPLLERNGFKGEFHKIAPATLFSYIFKDNQAETLLKLNQSELLRLYIQKKERDPKYKIESPMKTCIKNKYIIKDAIIWEDMINLQKYFNRDLSNAKYVCPADLYKQHDMLLEKKRNIERKRDFETLKTEMKENQKKYLADKKRFFGLNFQDGNLQVKFIKKVEDFLNEEYAHGHCVFRNEYFKKKNSLVFSASFDGIKKETVELSLTSLKVIQSRGSGNHSTEYHDQIINLVESNVHQIKEILNSKNKENVKAKIVRKHQPLLEAV